MTYPILALSKESTSEATAKLHFALATERAKGEEFLRVDFLCAEHVSRLRNAVLHVLKERNVSGRFFSFFLRRIFLPKQRRRRFLPINIRSLPRNARFAMEKILTFWFASADSMQCMV
jgi:hypothetical protein